MSDSPSLAKLSGASPTPSAAGHNLSVDKAPPVRTAAVRATALARKTGEAELSRRVELVEELRRLHEAHPTDEAVALALGAGLVNVTARASGEQCAAAADELRRLYDEGPCVALAQRLAAGLANLFTEAGADHAKIVEELCDLRHRYAGDRDVALRGEPALFTLILRGPPGAVDSFLDELRDLARAHPDSAPVALDLAQALANQTPVASVARRAEILDDLRHLRHHRPDNSRIALALANGLFVSAGRPDEPDPGARLAELADLVGTGGPIAADDLVSDMTDFLDEEDRAITRRGVDLARAFLDPSHPLIDALEAVDDHLGA